MFFHITEIVAGNEVSCQFVARIAQARTALVAHPLSVEDKLLTTPSSRQSIAYARVLFHVESLQGVVVDHLRRCQSMEVVDDQDRLGGCWLVSRTKFLSRETLPTAVESRHLESIEFARLQVHAARGSLNDLSVVKTSFTHSCIQNIRCRLGSRLAVVGLWTP